MLITQKSQYALRAIFELAKQGVKSPLKASEIAARQAIPVRFVEVILNKLKRSGLIESKRGYYGGYSLIRPPDQLTVAEVLEIMGVNFGPVACLAESGGAGCPLHGQCAFLPMWNQVQEAVHTVYGRTTIQHLLEYEEHTEVKSQNNCLGSGRLRIEEER